MQIKNNIKALFILFLSLFVFIINLHAEEFNISAKEILIEFIIESNSISTSTFVKPVDFATSFTISALVIHSSHYI